MEVILATGFSVGILILSIYLYTKNRNLRQETQSLGEALRNEIRDSQRQIEDQRATELELKLIKGKLEGMQSSGLTPDNSIPKHVYVEKVLDLSSNLQSTKAELDEMTQKFEDSRGKQISNRVKMGQIGEQFSTLHSEFKYNRKETKAILQPIDFVCFEDGEVIFIEVKTGQSKLSTKQKRIRDNIKAGRVRFEVFRIDENGATWSDK